MFVNETTLPPAVDRPGFCVSNHTLSCITANEINMLAMLTVLVRDCERTATHTAKHMQRAVSGKAHTSLKLQSVRVAGGIFNRRIWMSVGVPLAARL
jgi:hypothetical protein